MRHFAAAIAAAAALALPAHAVTFATDASDLWYNAGESGWGANVIQQADTLFVTFFVYDAAGKPTWFVGSDVPYVSTTSGNLVYSGDLYQTTGPYFGGSYSAPNVRKVGTVTFTLTSLTTATIAYAVDGVSVSKNVTRQTWKANNLTGTYVGANVGTYSGCAAGNGYVEEFATITVAHTGTSFRMVSVQPSTTCTFTGSSYAQDGRLGSVNGTVACTANSTTGQPAASGTFAAAEMEGGVIALSGRAGMQLGACQWIGRFGGLRRSS